MVINPSSLYSGGQGIFNSTPYTQFAIQQEAKRKAKDEALDKYYSNLPKSINGAGMRVKDIDGFMNKVNGIKQFYQQNKNAIKNPSIDNGRAQSVYQSMNTDVGMDVEKSKDRAAREKAALDFYNNKLKADERVPDDFWDDLNTNSLSIYETPDYAGFDLQKWSQKPPAFDQSKFVQKFKDVVPQVDTVKYEPITGFPLKQMEVTLKKFTPEQKEALRARAVNEYQNSYSFSNSVLEDLRVPEKKQQLEAIFTDQFGDVPKNKNDYAAAKTLQLLQTDLVSKKPVDNLEEIARRKKEAEEEKRRKNMQDWLAKNRITSRQADSRTLMNRFGAGEQPTTGNSFDEINVPSLQSGDRIVDGVLIDKENRIVSDEKKIYVPIENMPSSIITALKASGIDMKFVKGFDVKSKNGSITQISNERTGIINRQNMENYQKQFNKEPQRAPQPQFGKENKPVQNNQKTETIAEKMRRLAKGK